MARNPVSKVQRVRRAGGQRSQSGRPEMFVFLVVAVLLIGVLLVALARKSKVEAGTLQPAAGQDHWYEAYGTYVCDKYVEQVPEVTDPPSGLGPMANGLISVAPTGASSAGEQATFGVFATDAGIDVTASTVRLNGTKYDAADGCTVDGKRKRAELVLYRWPPQASERVSPEIFRGDAIRSARFDEDRAIYALAVVPKGTEKIALPPTVDALKNPTATGS